MERTILRHAELICSRDAFSTDICPMKIDYDIWIYNQIPEIQYGLSDTNIFSGSIFDLVSENLSNCHVWGCPIYILEPSFKKTGVKPPKGYPSILREVNMGFIKMH